MGNKKQGLQFFNKTKFMLFGVILICLINFFLLSPVLFSDKPIIHRDFNFPFVNENMFLDNYLSAWNEYTSSPTLENIFRLPNRIIPIFLLNLGLDLVTVLKFLVVSPFFLGTLFMFFLLAKLFNSPQNIFDLIVVVLCSLFFMYNPIMFIFVHTVGFILALAFLPLYCLIAINFFKHWKLSYLLILPIIIFFTSTHPFITFVYLSIFPLFSLYHFLFNKIQIQKLILSNMALIIIYLLLFLYFLVPLSFYFASSNSLDPSFKGYYNISEDVFQATSNNQILHLFLGVRDSIYILAQYPKDSGYPFWIFCSLILFILIYTSVFWKRNLEKELLFVLFLVFLIFTFGSSSLFGDVYYMLISLPLGWIFRSNLKFMLFSPFFFSIFLIILLSSIRLNKLKYALFLFVLFLSIVYIYPSFAAFTKVFSGVAIPEEINNLNQKISNDDACRIIWLPSYNSLQTTWSGDNMIGLNFGLSISKIRTYNYNLDNSNLGTLFGELNTSLVQDRLSNLNIKYIALHNDLVVDNSRKNKFNLEQSYSSYLTQNLRNVYSENGFELYQNDNLTECKKVVVTKDDGGECLDCQLKTTGKNKYEIVFHNQGSYLIDLKEINDPFWVASKGQKINGSLTNQFLVSAEPGDKITIWYSLNDYFYIGVILTIIVLLLIVIIYFKFGNVVI